MERPVYLDVDGRERERHEWDNHHVFAKSIMKGEGEVAWASLSGILVPVYREFHNRGSMALHNNVPHCPKPTKELRHIIRINLYENAHLGVYDRFIKVLEAVEQVSERTSSVPLGKNSERVLANLQRQAPFILNGMVIIGESNG